MSHDWSPPWPEYKTDVVDQLGLFPDMPVYQYQVCRHCGYAVKVVSGTRVAGDFNVLLCLTPPP